MSINISDALGHYTSRMQVSASATSVTFIKDTLSQLSPTNNGTINISLLKYNLQTFGGKNYLFISIFNYYKTGVTIQ